MTFLTVLDYLSVFVFALTGALTASRLQLDLVGFIFMACLTAVGGGTVRDLILDRTPIWVQTPGLIISATLAAIAVFFMAHLVHSRYRALLWLDAVALAIAVPAGAGAAISLGHGPIIVTLMAMMTGAFGGLMRDVVANEVPLVLKEGELYLSCAFTGAVAAVLAISAGFEQWFALILCGIFTFALRAGSMRWGWRLPVYKSRPPRDYSDR